MCPVCSVPRAQEVQPMLALWALFTTGTKSLVRDKTLRENRVLDVTTVLAVERPVSQGLGKRDGQRRSVPGVGAPSVFIIEDKKARGTQMGANAGFRSILPHWSLGCSTDPSYNYMIFARPGCTSGHSIAVQAGTCTSVSHQVFLLCTRYTIIAVAISAKVHSNVL